jgi:hypothetical protein
MTRRLHHLAATSTALVALLVPTVAVAVPAAAAPRPGCTALRPESEFYAAGRVATVLLTVPANPACTTISVSHIVDPAVPTDRCQDFLVGFFPADGGEATYTDLVTACSYGPRPVPVVLAADVPDGTTYRVLYQIDYLEQDLSFVVRH